MKLKNKISGEIKEFVIFDGNEMQAGLTLKDLAQEWEDVPEEPSKIIWQIKDSGELQDFEEDAFSDGYIESSKSIGNYFETKEEAEKAVEKLKAFKRLKDKGFKFEGYDRNYNHWHINFTFDNYCTGEPHSASDDLDLLFGGEE